MELDLPCFDDDGIDSLLADLPDGANVSIRGVSGSGKTIVGEYLVEAALAAGQACRMVIVGDREDGREVLNQATGIGLDLLSHIPDGVLAIDIVDQPGLREMLGAIVQYESVDVLLVDSLDSLGGVDPTTVEQALFCLGGEFETSVVCIGETGVGDPRPYADLRIDMTRAGEAVELWDADSILTIGTHETSVGRAFRVEGYGIRVWEPG